MKHYITFSALLIIVLLIGCAKRMDNKSIVEQVQLCEAAGLDVREIDESPYWDVVTDIQCTIPKSRRNQ